MLTRKQHELLRYINERLSQDGVSPSFDEMKDALGLKSKSGIHRLITALEERGFIRRLAHRARAIEIVKLPEALGKSTGFTPRVIEGSRRAAPRDAVDIDTGGAMDLPLMGRIAAGVPRSFAACSSSALEQASARPSCPTIRAQLRVPPIMILRRTSTFLPPLSCMSGARL